MSTYEMSGKGASFLKTNFDIFLKQTFKDFDVVISDQSRNDEIEKICKQYADKLDIKYFKEKPEATPSDNTNNAIKRATGQLIKILFLDDFLYKDTSLQEIVENFDIENDTWLITACTHTKDGKNFYWDFYPRFDGEKILMKNTVGAPSVVTVKNDNPVLFDTKLVWWQDLDYYRRSYERFGKPKILNTINTIITVGDHQMGVSSKEKVRDEEHLYILRKHGVAQIFRKRVIYKIKRYKRELKRLLLKYLSKNSINICITQKVRLTNFFITLWYKARFYPLKIRWNSSDRSVLKQVFIDKQYNLDYSGIDPKIIVDAGANVGYTSVFFARKFPQAKIFAIEPEHSNFSALKKNTAQFPFITPIEKALWYTKDTLEIIDQHQGAWAFKTEKTLNSHGKNVETVTMNEIINMSKGAEIDVLKIDIEGAEKELFSENYDSWLGKVKIIIIELHERMKKGCKENFYEAIKKYPFEISIHGELIVLKKIKS